MRGAQIAACVQAAPYAVVISAHIGDLESVLSVEVFRRAIDDLLDFFQADARSGGLRSAPRLCLDADMPRHLAAGGTCRWCACSITMPTWRRAWRNTACAGPVLGLLWDGTGYGPDGTIWGGEVLLCEGPEFHAWPICALSPCPAAIAAARQPRRSALGLLYEMLGPEQATEYAADWFAPSELDALAGDARHGIHCPRTSSMGRLFDAVAALCGLPPVISFEGQAAMALEYAADENEQESLRACHRRRLDDASMPG